MAAESNYRCQCGGIMRPQTRRDPATQQDQIWYVCPFCSTQRQVTLGQDDGGDERVLTQPAPHP